MNYENELSKNVVSFPTLKLTSIKHKNLRKKQVDSDEQQLPNLIR